LSLILLSFVQVVVGKKPSVSRCVVACVSGVSSPAVFFFIGLCYETWEHDQFISTPQTEMGEILRQAVNSRITGVVFPVYPSSVFVIGHVLRLACKQSWAPLSLPHQREPLG